MKVLRLAGSCFFLLAFFGLIPLGQTLSVISADEVNTDGQQSYQTLLDSYISNDRQFKELSISFEQAKLDYTKTLIQNSLSWSVSSGSVRAKLGTDSTSISVSPSASISIPEFNNSELKMSSPLSFEFGDDGTTYSLNGTGLSFSTDVISSADEKRALTLIKADRSLEEAQRRLDARILAIEKEFLTELRSLFNAKISVISKEDALNSKQRDLDSLKVQGYEEKSSRYRTSFLSYQSALRDYEEQQRAFEKALLSLANECSLDSVSLDFVLPSEELVRMEDFDKEQYKELESSTWTHYSNSLSRDSSSALTLSADAGYALSLKSGKDSGVEVGNTVSTGVSLKYNGLNLSAGLELPIEDIKNPSVSLSISWNPNEKKLSDISEQEEALDVQKEMLSIESAVDSYETLLSDKDLSREDLIWQSSKNAEQLSMYKDLADDMKTWYDKGVISLIDYKEALTNYEKALAQIKITQIEHLLYNIEIKSLFINQ